MSARAWTRAPHDRSGDDFDPSRTGMDHLSLSVGDRADLDAWTRQLEQNGVTPSPVRDAGSAEFISLVGRDGIQVELWWANRRRKPCLRRRAVLRRQVEPRERRRPW